jgi:hemolysin D
MDGRPFNYTGSDPHLALEAAIFAQRMSEYNFKLEGYRQKADSLSAQVAKSRSDVVGYQDRLGVAVNLEKMRNELDRLGVGSKLNTCRRRTRGRKCSASWTPRNRPATARNATSRR